MASFAAGVPAGANASRFAPPDPVREAGARTNNAFEAGLLIATFRCAAPARCGAFVDERCVVADCSWFTTTKKYGPMFLAVSGTSGL